MNIGSCTHEHRMLFIQVQQIFCLECKLLGDQTGVTVSVMRALPRPTAESGVSKPAETCFWISSVNFLRYCLFSFLPVSELSISLTGFSKNFIQPVRSRRCSWIRQKKLPIIRSAGVQFLVAFEFGGGGLSVAMVAG